MLVYVEYVVAIYVAYVLYVVHVSYVLALYVAYVNGKFMLYEILLI